MAQRVRKTDSTGTICTAWDGLSIAHDHDGAGRGWGAAWATPQPLHRCRQRRRVENQIVKEQRAATGRP